MKRLKETSRPVRWGMFLFLLTLFVHSASAQEKGPGPGMMAGGPPEAMAKMMQEQNKVLANASIQYLAAFTSALHVQADQRRDQIGGDFIRRAFGEMKRSLGLIEQFQAAHVKTMDDAMQTRVKMMMDRMNRNLAGLKENLDLLEKEVNGRMDLAVIASRTGAMLQYLDDLSKMRSAQGGAMPLSAPKEMMK
jgi:hypothetical protein